MAKFLKYFEKVVAGLLIGVMAIIALLMVVDLVWNLVEDALSPPFLILTVNEALDVFGYVMLVLIGLELLETIRVYFKEKAIHVEVVLEVALIAVARKVIILDYKKTPSTTLLGIAAIIVALAAAFYAMRRIRRLPETPSSPD